MNISDELKDKLQTLVHDVYGCQKLVETAKIQKSEHLILDDEQFSEHLIKEHCEAIDADELFEEVLNECYGSVKVGCCEWNAGHVMKELDPIAFRCGVSDYLADDERFVEVDGEHYQVSDIVNMIDALNQ